MALPLSSASRRRRRPAVLVLAAATLVGTTGLWPAAAQADPPSAATSDATPAATSDARPDFGPNVRVFDPSMPVAQIQATVDAIAAAQLGNQFGPQRYALLFKPGTYGSVAQPLNVQVGYYTTVSGLGLSPNDTTINGSVYVHNQCENGSCVALNNFWRSVSNLTIDVANTNGCYTGEFWAVSQAAPMRRVHVVGNGQNITLMDYCTSPSFASGGFIADSQFDGQVINGSQQQWFVRNSVLSGWSNGVWNQVFSGTVGAPATCFPAVANGCGPYTTVAAGPVSREAPFLYVDAAGRYRVFVPAARTNSVGTSWGNGPAAGRSVPLSRFVVARPGDRTSKINDELEDAAGLLLTPGTYSLDRAIRVKKADTVVLGLGMPSLVPQGGASALTVGDVPGVDLAGLTVDAGPVNSPVLMQIGTPRSHKSSAADPTALHDVFFRIGGPAAGKATVSLEVNSDRTILDDIWAWRADHGNGVGWTVNTADTGVVVNGDDVIAYGLFVEHYQKTETIWNGQRGTVVFFQNEMPYDPPSQAAWTQASGVKGYPALKVAPSVRSFTGYGMGSYSFFNQGVDILSDNAFEVPATLPTGSLRDLLTIFLDASTGKGGISNVVNGVGGSSTIANPDVPVTVVSYP